MFTTMKVFIFLVCIFGGLNVIAEGNKTCTEKPETGICLALFRMWYYDPETQSCKRFIYGGCRGNGNRYRSEKECMDNCKGVVTEPKQLNYEREVDCNAPPVVGLCKALKRRFYYNPLEGRCMRFNYGGCGGNSNNFRTEEECNKKCGTAQETCPDPNSKYNDCGTSCPKTCENPKPQFCIQSCKAGCFCNSPYVDNNGKCVLPNQCPK